MSGRTPTQGNEADLGRKGRRTTAEEPGQAEELPDRLRARIAELGLEVRLRRLGTPGQLAFAVPVRGLDYWQARLIRDRKLVTHGEGVTPEGAVVNALGALDRG